MKPTKAFLLRAGVIAAGVVSGAWTPLVAPDSATAAPTKSCVSSQLAVSSGRPQGTAGTTYIPLVFTNKGATCALWGVATIQPVTGGAHRALGPLARNLSMGEMPVRQVIARGHAVSDALGVVDTGNFSPSACVARTANGVVVSLGSFVHATFLHLPITVCTKRSSVTTRLLVPGVNGY